MTGPGPNNNWFDGDDEIAEDREPCNDKGGISQRTNDLVFRTTLARRFGMLEPYIGFRAQISFPDKEDTSRYGAARNIPVTAETHFGMEIVPWERPQKAQYLTVGIHFWGGWTRETLNYGPLFDVLGTNPNMRFRFDLSETNRQDRDEAGAYSGLTRVEGHGFFGGRLAVTMQAAKYVKFALDLGLVHVQEHFGTFTDECRVPRVDENPDPPDIPNSCAETGGIFRDRLAAPGGQHRPPLPHGTDDGLLGQHDSQRPVLIRQTVRPAAVFGVARRSGALSPEKPGRYIDVARRPRLLFCYE